MNKNDLVMLIMAKKTLDYQKDPNPDNWVTISGAKVHLDEGGKIDGGAKGKFNGKSYSGTKKSHKSATGSSESSKKYESKAREAVEYWVNTHYKNPSDKNIKDSVESVRMQMESMVKSAERNLNDAKKTGKEDLIKKYQDKFDEAKGTLEALNNYYDGGTVKKESAKEPKLGAPKSPKKKIDPASTEAQAKRQAIADDMMKRTFVKGKVEEASKKLIAEANKDYGGDHETSVMLENVVKDKDGAYVTLKIVAKDKTGKSRFPQSHSMTFKVGDLTKEQKKLYFGKGETPAKEPKKSAPKSAGKEDDVKQVEISFPGGYKGHFSQVPGEKDVIFDWDKMERMEIPGGLEAFLKKAKEKGIEVNENYTPEERKLEEYPPSRQDRRHARMNKLQSRASRHGRPPGSR